ncbi:M48 family metalloprotease [Hydrogenophaga sp.]|uniref:M48 family metalloprotease n=1 Tax=Hydrogenophaga sp. TaxID=1904254 RepID=UPI00260BABF8|nr:M48 family metalloprotease [Hydrogenophaga sp.]MDM7950062.1 M48 family metalloprotease [Hydrogenophaga sp.]
MQPNRRLSLAIALTAALLAGCGTQVVNPVTGKTELSAMDERTEIAEGKKGHELILAEYGVVKDARLQAYVNQVGQRLAAQSHRPALPWTFTVLDSPEINAFALPGGYVYVTRGILAYMESEADMAGVIGHEIGHVTARHGAQRATRQQNAGLGVLAASVLGAVLESQGVSGAADLSSQVAQGVAAGYIAKYSREQELQADTLGAEYLARNRYNPSNMVDVIQVLKSQEVYAADQARAEGRPVREGDDWLASHPSNVQRLQSIRQNAAAHKGQYGDDGRERFLQAIRGMTFGDSPEQGLVRGQNFYHPELGIGLTAQPGWRIQNSPSALSFVSPQGDAALRMLAVPPKTGTTHDAILKDGLKANQGRVTRGTINGLAATHFAGTRLVNNGQTQPLEATIVTGPNNANYALLYLAANDAARNRAMAAMNATEKTFRPLSAADARNARPWAVNLVPFPRGGFAALQTPGVSTERQLRLLNGLYDGGSEPRVGQLVKVVGVR